MPGVIHKLMTDLFRRILIQDYQKKFVELLPEDFRTEASDFVRSQPASVSVSSSSSNSSIPRAPSPDRAIFVQPTLDIKVHHEFVDTYRTGS